MHSFIKYFAQFYKMYFRSRKSEATQGMPIVDVVENTCQAMRSCKPKSWSVSTIKFRKCNFKWYRKGGKNKFLRCFKRRLVLLFFSYHIKFNVTFKFSPGVNFSTIIHIEIYNFTKILHLHFGGYLRSHQKERIYS